MASRKVLALVLALLLLPTLGLIPPMTSADNGDGPTSPWDTGVRVDSGPKTERSLGSIRLARGPEGTFYAAWLENRFDGNDCFVSASGDGGVTWREDKRVDPYYNSPRTSPTTCDVGVDDEGHVYVTYCQRVADGWRVFWVRSDDGARNFRPPIAVNQISDPSRFQEHPELALSRTGDLYLLYMDRTQTSRRLFTVRSDDGLVAQSPRAVEPDAPADISHVQGDIAVSDDGTVYIAYGYRTTGRAGIRLAWKGSTQGAFDVKEVYGIDEAVPRELRPRLAVSPDGVLEIAFVAEGDEGRIIHIRSEDGGATFSDVYSVWSVEGEEQKEPFIAFDELEQVHAVWTQEGEGPARVLHSYSKGGVTFTAPLEVGGAWDPGEMGPRGYEVSPSILALDDGTLTAAFAADRNNSVVVNFTTWFNDPPVADFTFPDDGDEVRGTVAVQGTALDPGGVSDLATIYVKVGDHEPARLPGATAWEHEFDCTVFPDGPLPVEVWASDGFTRGESATITLDVDNNQPPTLTIGSPASGSVHRGRVHIVGAVEDVEGLHEGWKVQWGIEGSGWTLLEGATLLDENNADYDATLDLRMFPSGNYQLSVRASDGDKYSGPVHVTVNIDNRPDLALDIEGISWQPAAPKAGDPVTITVVVENLGIDSVDRYIVECHRGVVMLGRLNVTDLRPNGREVLAFPWTAVGGNNTFDIKLDPGAKVDEWNETNNEHSFHILVEAPEKEKGGGTPLWAWGVIALVIAIVVVAGVIMTKIRLWGAGVPEPEVVTVEGDAAYYSDGYYGDEGAEEAPEDEGEG